jgi:hypothetical protein
MKSTILKTLACVGLLSASAVAYASTTGCCDSIECCLRMIACCI